MASKYPNLKNKIIDMVKDENLDQKSMYQKFIDFKKEYSDLFFSTYTRMVRREVAKVNAEKSTTNDNSDLGEKNMESMNFHKKEDNTICTECGDTISKCTCDEKVPEKNKEYLAGNNIGVCIHCGDSNCYGDCVKKNKGTREFEEVCSDCNNTISKCTCDENSDVPNNTVPEKKCTDCGHYISNCTCNNDSEDIVINVPINIKCDDCEKNISKGTSKDGSDEKIGVCGHCGESVCVCEKVHIKGSNHINASESTQAQPCDKCGFFTCDGTCDNNVNKIQVKDSNNINVGYVPSEASGVTKVPNNKGKGNYDKCNGEFKRIVVMSDAHTGSQYGLTPPDWQYSEDNYEMADIARVQKESWNWYLDTIDRIGKDIDILIFNGDLMDGGGEISKGTEIYTSDKALQSKIGAQCLSLWNAKEVFMTRGTPYHTGKGEDFEDIAAERLGATIDDVLNLEIYGKIYNIRHKVSGSGVPSGKVNGLLKSAIWNQLTANYNGQKKADVVIRSHVHKMAIYQDSTLLGIVTPSLQNSSKYARKQLDGYSDFGLILITAYENGHIVVEPFIADIDSGKPKIIKV